MPSPGMDCDSSLLFSWEKSNQKTTAEPASLLRSLSSLKIRNSLRSNSGSSDRSLPSLRFTFTGLGRLVQMLSDGIRNHFPPIVGTQGHCVRKDEMHQMIVETPHCDVSTGGGRQDTGYTNCGAVAGRLSHMDFSLLSPDKLPSRTDSDHLSQEK